MFNLEQKQKHDLIMTQNLKQAIKLLNYNVFELSHFLENEADLNIFIDLKNPIKENLEERVKKEEHNIIESEKDEGVIYRSSSSNSFNENISNKFKEYTLKDSLLFQIGLLDIKKQDKKYLEYIINYVDSKGYLNIELNVLSSILCINIESVKKYINILKTFEPCGICAKNPIERIEIQLKNKGIYKKEHSILLKNYMENIAYGRINSIHLKTGFDTNYINSLIKDIKLCKLNITDEFVSSFDNLYIYPELKVVKKNNNIEVSLIEENSPHVYIDKQSLIEMSYMIKDRDLNSFYKQDYNRALFIISAVKKRRENMIKITKEIFKVQYEFLESGKLKPLSMSQIADVCNINVSTVSRIVNEKYVDTNKGVFALKTFFKKSVGGNDYKKDSTDIDIKNKIKNIIINEDEDKPLSDEKISKILKERGYNVSRRTVNKYRTQMGIPSTTIRRKEKKQK